MRKSTVTYTIFLVEKIEKNRKNHSLKEFFFPKSAIHDTTDFFRFRKTVAAHACCADDGGRATGSAGAPHKNKAFAFVEWGGRLWVFSKKNLSGRVVCSFWKSFCSFFLLLYQKHALLNVLKRYLCKQRKNFG